MKLKFARLIKRLLLLMLLSFGAVTAYVLYLVVVDNFHVVSPGRVYRSRQMSSRALARVIPECGIKTILNLRGENGSSSWYRAETNTAGQLIVKHFDFALSAGREVTDPEIENILTIIRTSPKPVLIHCQAGADRTGLISALYLYGIEGKAADEAGRELSIRYGHFPYLFWGNTGAMHYSFRRYVSNHANHAKSSLPPQAASP